MSRETMVVWLVLVVGAGVGVAADTLNWPVDNWLVIETGYLAVVGLLAGTIRDIKRSRNRPD